MAGITAYSIGGHTIAGAFQALRGASTEDSGWPDAAGRFRRRHQILVVVGSATEVEGPVASAFAMASRMDGLVRSRTRKVPSFIRVTDSRRWKDPPCVAANSARPRSFGRAVGQVVAVGDRR